jgi:hypothetical protein
MPKRYSRNMMFLYRDQSLVSNRWFHSISRIVWALLRLFVSCLNEGFCRVVASRGFTRLCGSVIRSLIYLYVQYITAILFLQAAHRYFM